MNVEWRSNRPEPTSEEGRLLIIEDDDAIRVLLRRVFERHGLAVDTANGGIEGIAHLDKQQYGCILLDLMMSRGNGFDVIDYLAQRGTPPPPVIVFSAADDPIFKALDPHVVTVSIRKPFDLDTVVDIVKALVEGA